MLAIIDSGIANVGSVANALAALGIDATVTADPAVIRAADRLILPGVGAFADAMRSLCERGLIEILNEEVLHRGKPILGICLGMQLFTETGLEHGEHRGLGWIRGRTAPFEFNGQALRVPHVGWNDCKVAQREPLFAGLPDQPDFYFVHSFRVQPESQDVVAATCDYGGAFVAAVMHRNLAGVQFHPEKSHQAGLTLLKNFAAWTPRFLNFEI